MAYPPTSFTATVATNSTSTINLAWTDTTLSPPEFGPGAWDRTYIYRSTDGATYAYLGWVSFGTETYQDISCVSNDQYWYKARHFELDSSTWSSYSTPDDDWTHPSPPTNLSASTVNASAINLAWSNGEVNYSSIKVERDSGEISSESGSATSYGDTGLTSNTLYTYRVRGYNSTSTYYSAYSATDTDTTWPAPPTSLSATVVGTTAIDLSWTNGEVNYNSVRVERDSVEISSEAGSATTYSDTGLNSNTTYSYTVRGYNSTTGFYSVYSTPAVETTTPDPPTGLTSTGVSTTGIDLSWVNGETNYDYVKVERDSVEISSEAGSATTYSDTGLTASTSYTYRVRGYNSTTTDYSAYSTTYTVSTADAHTASATDTLSITESVFFTTTTMVTDATAISDSVATLHGAVATATETVTVTDVSASVLGYVYAVTETVTVTDAVSPTVYPVTNIAYFLGSDDGKLYSYHEEYKGDDGSSITAVIQTKQTDFADQIEGCEGLNKTVYKIQLWYVDLETDSLITVYVSTDGGNTWTAKSKTIGSSQSTPKSVDFHFIKTGQYFSFKIEHGSASESVQILGMDVFLTIGGLSFTVA